jgi:hypothetical protein
MLFESDDCMHMSEQNFVTFFSNYLYLNRRWVEIAAVAVRGVY